MAKLTRSTSRQNSTIEGNNKIPVEQKEDEAMAAEEEQRAGK
jgi:hypothetical protein